MRVADFFFPLLAATTAALSCDPVRLPKRGIGPHGAVCKCNETHCDEVAPVGTVPPEGFVTYSTSLHNDTERLSRSEGSLEPQPLGSADDVVEVNVTAKYQRITGFGAAFTDASVLAHHALALGAAEHLLRSYWGPTGLRYSTGRIPIASTDFSTSVYTYNDARWAAPGVEDLNLTHFSVAVDEHSGKLPLIRRALNLSAAVAAPTAQTAQTAQTAPTAQTAQMDVDSSTRPPLRLFGSSWGPPAWMTTGNSSVHDSHLRDAAGGPVHKAYARYLAKFVEAYEARGVRLWALTAGNEPTQSTKWQNLRFTAAQQRDFIKLDLGPALRKAAPQCALMILDDQRSKLPKWAETVLSDPDAAQFVAGIGVHWYAAAEDFLNHFPNLAQTHEKYPQVFILGTEACEGFLPWSGGPYPGDWLRGERYALDVLGDLNHWAVGWTDWNFALDLAGGPNWSGNNCDAPILIDTPSSTKATPGSVQAFFKQPMYYYYGHIAAFVAAGATRLGWRGKVDSATFRAFLTPDGQRLVVIVMNRAGGARDVAVKVPRGWINARMAAHSIRTFVVQM